MVSGMRRVSEVLVGVGWSLRAGVARRSELQYGRVDGCAGVPQAGVTSTFALCAREAGKLAVRTVLLTVLRYQAFTPNVAQRRGYTRSLVTLCYRNSNGGHPELPGFTGQRSG